MNICAIWNTALQVTNISTYALPTTTSRHISGRIDEHQLVKDVMKFSPKSLHNIV